MNQSNQAIDNIALLEKNIGYCFNNKETILTAITHSSYANERKTKKIKYNERIEFLGDSILSLVISEYLYRMYPTLPEGELTVTRARIVCESSLSRCANDIELGSYLQLGKGEELSGGRNKASILSDAFEALIGAIYIDGSFDISRNFILKYMEKVIKSCVDGKLFYDYKTQLQEIIQQNAEQHILYSVIEESGPDHNKTFVIEVKINDIVAGQGKGHSKKEAEQNAAKDAMEKIK